MPALNLLVQPGRVHSWLRAPLISALARLPLRPRGVQHTIEFILAVHPSNSGSSRSVTTGSGSVISHEALNSASRLLSSPPEGMSPTDWFQGIAPQMLSLLEGDGQLEMDKAAAFVIGFGILGRKQFGAPGTPGWKALVDPILHKIDPPVGSQKPNISWAPDNPIITLGSHKILVSSLDVARSLRRLSALVTSHPHPSLAKRLLTPIVLPLWSLSYWPGNDHTELHYRKPAKKLLKTLLQLSPAAKQPSKGPSNPSNLSPLHSILQNITFNGRAVKGQVGWAYVMGEDGGIQIEDISQNLHSEVDTELDFTRLDSAVKSFVTLLGTLSNLHIEISDLFIDLCDRWLHYSAKTNTHSIVTHIQPIDGREDLKSRLVEAQVMQQMMTAFPEKLVEDSQQLLELLSQVLAGFTAATVVNNGDEDSVAVALSLLNIVLTSSSFRATSEGGSRLESIKSSLQSISRQTQLEVSSTAQNILLLLEFRTTVDESEAVTSSNPTNRQREDRKSFNLAMSYITAADSPTPVRAQGIELLSDLIRSKSPILDIPSLLVLFSSLLQDEEEYIYLRVIHSFIQLSQNHPRAVMNDIIDRYVDSTEEYELDQRLRIGEVLLQVIQSNSPTFVGEDALRVSEGLLFIASRRVHRAKTEIRQQRKNALKRKQNDEAEEAWGGPVPPLDEVLDIAAQEEENILPQIVSGWESKRGAEDIRVRTSALSILGTSIECHIESIGSKIIAAAVDLSIHILTLETEPEYGILRRAAVLLIMSFIKALNTAMEEGKKIGFGFAGQSLDDVQRILRYVQGIDNDGLVRQFAGDVVEGLQAWQISALIPVQREQTGIQELAGLSIKTVVAEDARGMNRPRIEEIE